MCIRIRTLRELSRRNRSIARVRWRGLAWVDGALKANTDGAAGRPETWQRWEEEYFVRVDMARAALDRDPHGHLRPRGVLDQVRAAELWGCMNREALSGDPESVTEYENGLLRVLGPMGSGPGRLRSDEVLTDALRFGTLSTRG